MAASSSISTVETSTTYITSTIALPTSTYTSTITSSFAVVDIYTKLPDQPDFIYYTKEWWTFSSSLTPTTPATTTTSPPGQTTGGSVTSASSTTGRSSSPSPASPASTDTPQLAQVSSSSGLSRGAIAGIAIGCAVAGLILGIIAGFLLFRRRRRPGPEIGYHTTQLVSQEKPLQEIATDRLDLDQFLLDSTPDTEISAELRSLNHLLQQHVEDNYHLQPVSSSTNDLSQALLRLGLGQDGTMTAMRLASLSLDPAHRYNAIQHVIARVTFASIAFDEASPFSLLPQPVFSFVSMIPAVENRRGNTDAVNVALTRWRQLSAFLLHPERSDRTPLTPPEDISTHKAQQLAVNLNVFLQHFVAGSREDRYEQENHLREVIAECATFGYHLFSQPSEYRFRFEDGLNPNSIVVCPGLDKISDEEGRRYPPPTQPVVAPVVESI
ncbi:hypothetical protein Hte_010764 [Hypoxylon texense]